MNLFTLAARTGRVLAPLRTPPAQKWAERIEELDDDARRAERRARIWAAVGMRRSAAAELRLATSQRRGVDRMRTCPKRPDPSGERPLPLWVRMPLDVWRDTWPWVVTAVVVSLLSDRWDRWAFGVLAVLVAINVVMVVFRAIRAGVRR